MIEVMAALGIASLILLGLIAISTLTPEKETGMQTTSHHTITVTRDADTEYGPEASITCPGVTDTCAEWIECKQPDCPANTDGDDTLYDVCNISHGLEHRYFDEGPGVDYWGVRSGHCYAENHGDAAAVEFAEEHDLAAGRYAVNIEVDDSTVILTLAATPAEVA